MKIGRLTDGAKLQVLLPPLNKPDSAVLDEPELAVSEIVGKKAARAAPMSAFEPCSVCSAASTSGRCCSSVEGSPAGTSTSALAVAMPAAGNSSSGTVAPASRSSALRSSATCAV